MPRTIENWTLTPHLLEILRLAAQGLTAKKVAKRFGTSHRTIEIQRALIVDLLGGVNMCNAVALAVAKGILKKGEGNTWTAALPPNEEQHDNDQEQGAGRDVADGTEPVADAPTVDVGAGQLPLVGG